MRLSVEMTLICDLFYASKSSTAYGDSEAKMTASLPQRGRQWWSATLWLAMLRWH